jgi:alkanesulfonate monooxygenase SsuD/methylene tetrahydromethanopterin reductase-like flavin-dependent oxidoreductase (luciferase family)
MVLAAAAQRTSRIRLGTAVTLLPLHSPIEIAEEAAIADILSDGRLEFGGGRDIARHYPSYGIPPEENRVLRFAPGGKPHVGDRSATAALWRRGDRRLTLQSR